MRLIHMFLSTNYQVRTFSNIGESDVVILKQMNQRWVLRKRTSSLISEKKMPSSYVL